MVMRKCDRCGEMYVFEHSTAELRLTYCTAMCEAAAMVPVSVLLHAERGPDGEARARVWKRIRAAVDDPLMTEAAR